MSVTIITEIDKANVLIAGLRKHLDEVKQLGISTDAINKMEEAGKSLKQKDEEMDALRRQSTLKARENRELLADLKSQMLEIRKTIKGNFPQTDWIKYGVQDKR